MKAQHKISTAAISIVLSVLMVSFFSFPFMSYGEEESEATNANSTQTTVEQSNANDDGLFEPSAPSTYITVNYYEHYSHDLDGNPSDSGTRLLGSRAFPANAGDEISAWDYVADIPGFFFWDGWPNEMTVSDNPDDNVIDLFYFRLSVSTYTVNYYAMTGADLTADSWAGALATHPQFHYLGHNTFTGQLFGKLVEGNNEAIPIDEAYTVGTYPDSIRLTLDAQDNVINVLYAPKAVNLPDEDEIIENDDTDDGDAGNIGGDEEVVAPGDTDNMLPDGDDEEEGVVPPDDEITAPPAGFPPAEIIGPDEGGDDDGTLIEITDEMIANGANEQQAQLVKDAYKSGLEQGASLAQTGDELGGHIMFLVGVALIAAGTIGVIVWKQRKDA